MRAFDLRARYASISALLLASSVVPGYMRDTNASLAAVVREHRRARAAGKVGEALRFAAGGQVE